MGDEHLSIAKRYHEATKYCPDTIGSHPSLDWSIQPDPWKEFQSDTRVDLASELLVVQDEESGRPILRPEPQTAFGIGELATLLLHTNGATAVTRDAARPVYFRAAPSAGALYPTEIYVFLRDIDGIEDGIYNFQVRDHSLAPVMEGDFGHDLNALTAAHPAIADSRCIFLFSAVYFRSSWRYQERGYRRILLDTGHILGNLVCFAEELGLGANLIGNFADSAIDDLMLFPNGKESVIALAALSEEGPGYAVIGRSEPESASNQAADMKSLHEAGRIRDPESSRVQALIPRALEPTAAQTVVSLPAPHLQWDDQLCATILGRRSTRRFDGSSMSRAQFSDILGYSYESLREMPGKKKSEFFDAGRLSTWVSVHNVDDVEPGLYRFDPVAHRLLLIRKGQHQLEDHHVALGQDLARQAAVVIYHSTDLDEAVRQLGARAYRFLNLDAGHIGQRLNLAALKLDLGASGIGGYFDDEINRLFGMPASESILYMTCMGRPA